MANVTWKDGTDNWTTVGDWSNGAVPGAADAVTVAQGDPQITTNVGTIASLNVSAKLDLSNGGALVVTGTAAISGTIGVDAAAGTGGAGMTVGGILTNSGTLNIGNSALATPTTVNLGGIANFLGNTLGTINIAGGAKAATLAVSGPAGFGVQGTEIGSVSLSGNAVVDFATGQISTIRGTLALKSAGASIQDHGQGQNSALTGLTSIAAGGLYLSGGASLTTSGALSNAGTIQVGLDGVGGTSLTIGGTLTNTGTLLVGANQIGANVGISVQGALSGTSGTTTITGSNTHTASLTVSGAAGFGAAGSLYGNVTLYNDAVVQFGSGGITNVQGNLILNGNATTSIRDQGQGVNSALAGLSSVSGSVDLLGVTLATTGDLSNTGTIGIDDAQGAGGGNVTIGGTVTNTAAVQIGNGDLSAHTSVSFGGIVNAVGTTYGRLALAGGVPNQQTGLANQTLLSVQTAAGFGTAGTLTGSVYLYNDAQIRFSSGEINTIATGGQLTLYGAMASISNDGTLNSALTGLTTVDGSLTLQNGAAVTTSGSLSTTGGLWADFGSTLTVGGTLTNSGTVLIGVAQLTASSTINAGSLVNSIGSTGGLIDLKGGLTNPATGLAQAQALLSVNGAAGFGPTGSLVGSVNLTDDAVIKFASGGITTITSGSELTLSGAMASITTDGTVNGALAGLSTVAGSLTLENGASVTTTGSLSDQGTITVDSSGSNLTVGGTLTVTGALNISGGSVSAPAVVSVGSLDNLGGGLRSGISVTGGATDPQTGLAPGATLSVNTVAGFGTPGVLQGNVYIQQSGEILFTGGQINTIASGGSLTLTYAMASISNDGSVNSALTGLTTIAGKLELQGGSTLTTTGPMSNTGMVAVVYGSSLTVGGVLTNTGAVTIGGDQHSTTVNVGGLTNFHGAATGSIDVFMESSVDLATLNVSGTAGFGTAGVEIGTVSVSGHSVIQFGTGQISTIQGSLTLDGEGASIQDQGQGANSALTGLTTVSGSLTVENGASLATGTATTVSNTLTVGNTLTVSGTVSASHIAVQSGGTLILTGGGTASGPIAIGSGGTFEGIGAAGAVTVASGGTFAPGADPGTMTTGSVSLASGSTFGIEIGGTAAGSYDQDQVTGTVSLGGATFHGTLVNGFVPTVGNSFTIISNDGTDAVNGTFAGLPQGGTTLIGGDAFAINYAGGDGNDVVLTDLGLPCYAEGTLILTEAGEVPVERLAVGDLVVTADGERRPIRWIGHRMVDCRSHPEVRSVWPVRVAAHAFGENRPARDLFVSPDHALCIPCVEEVLIPARRLVNGSTVTRHPVDRIGYWHIELDSHDLLVANGLPAESYLEMGNRRFFSDAEAVDLHGRPDGDAPSHDAFCRPFVEDGPVLDVVRLQVEARAKRRGWAARHAVDIALVREGRAVDGLRCGDALVALFPAGAGDLHLRSDTFVPDDGDGRGDERSLGVCLLGLSVRGSGSEARAVRLDDSRLEEGFHNAEESGGRLLRWTRGEAILPATLWEGLTGIVALHLDLDLDAIRGWQAPARSAAAVDRRPRSEAAATPVAPTGQGRPQQSATAPRDEKGSSGYSVTLSQPFMPRRSWGRKRAL